MSSRFTAYPMLVVVATLCPGFANVMCMGALSRKGTPQAQGSSPVSALLLIFAT